MILVASADVMEWGDLISSGMMALLSGVKARSG